MADLIRRVDAIEAFDDERVDRNYGDVSPESVIRVIESIPTVDAVPVVRCFQCKHWKCFGDAEDGDYDIGTCELYNQGFGAECFCSDGERKEEQDG